MRFILISSIFFLFSLKVSAHEKELYFFGGGGEPKTKTKTIFDEDLINILNFSKKSDWKTTFAFNGGHAESEKIMSTLPKNVKSHGELSKDNYTKMLKEIKEKLISNKLKAGDQLMLVLDTHGLEKLSKKEKTHQIALKNGYASVDDLETILSLAEEKNVNVALVDLSCHSGNTLNLSSKKSCFISASGAKHFAFTHAKSFPTNFTRNLKKGLNLEDIFLEARDEDYTSMEFPMISTEEGKTIQNLIYELLTPYFYYNNSSGASLLKKHYIHQTEDKICSIKTDYNTIQKLIDSLEQIDKFSNSSRGNPIFEDFRSALKKYHDYQIEYASILLDQKKLSEKLFQLISKDKNLNKTVALNNITKENVLQIDFESVANKYEKRLLETDNEDTKKYIIGEIQKAKENKKTVESLIEKLDSKEQEKLKLYKIITNDEQKSWEYAHEVATQVKKLYTNEYTKIKRTESNPCRDFTL